MNVKQVKRMCSVKGCRSTDSYAISKIKEWGGVIICGGCLADASAETKGHFKNEKNKNSKKPVSSLFYHPEEKVTKESDKQDGDGNNELKCPNCGKLCKNALGLNTHLRSCKVKDEPADKKGGSEVSDDTKDGGENDE